MQLKGKPIFQSPLFNTDFDEMPPDEEQFLWDDWHDCISDVSGKWLVIADLGLWDGTHHAWRVCNSLRDVFDVIARDCPEYEVYESPQGKVTVRGVHHDGTNMYEIRRFTADGEAWVKNNYSLTKTTMRKHTRAAHLRKLFGWV